MAQILTLACFIYFENLDNCIHVTSFTWYSGNRLPSDMKIPYSHTPRWADTNRHARVLLSLPPTMTYINSQILLNFYLFLWHPPPPLKIKGGLSYIILFQKASTFLRPTFVGISEALLLFTCCSQSFEWLFNPPRNIIILHTKSLTNNTFLISSEATKEEAKFKIFFH